METSNFERVEPRKVKFVNWRLYTHYNQQGIAKFDRGLMLSSNTNYRMAGGDDWRRFDTGHLHYRGSCDTNNGFIYNEETKQFCITRANGYDFDKFYGLTIEQRKKVFEEIWNDALAYGTYKSFTGANKATGMVITHISTKPLR